MARVVGRFFAELAADRAPTYVDPATAIFVERARAWVMNATVDRNVRIGPLATIGCSGMGYERGEQGRLVPFPQLGGVLLEDDTDIAVQAMIQRGAIGDTLVRRGAKIAPHVNVGHSVEVGEDALVTGHAQIGGGARIGARAAVWQNVAIANGVTIGEGAVVGMGAMIREDIGLGEGWAGNPGRRLRYSFPRRLRRPPPHPPPIGGKSASTSSSCSSLLSSAWRPLRRRSVAWPDSMPSCASRSSTVAPGGSSRSVASKRPSRNVANSLTWMRITGSRRRVGGGLRGRRSHHEAYRPFRQQPIVAC